MVFSAKATSSLLTLTIVCNSLAVSYSTCVKSKYFEHINQSNQVGYQDARDRESVHGEFKALCRMKFAETRKFKLTNISAIAF